MSQTAEQFAKSVVAAGLTTSAEIKSLWGSLPADERPRDGESFSKLLIERNLLTEFQAQRLLTGDQTPLVLGDYVLLSKIGAGGMGQVFKARHRHMERLVAIKLLPSELTKNEDAVKRFQREVKAAAKLIHPNIVQAYDASVQRGIWYLVMEYVEGRDLAAIARLRETLPISDVVNFMAQAARALAFAHENGVVHRDIKPANLLLNKQGVVKILDMGLARIDDTSGDAAQQGLTQSGQVMGTVDYMAPEQAFDMRSVDARSDIYSLGCTLYRLLTGQNMYDGETLVQKLMAHQSKPIPSLIGQHTEVPPALEAIYQRMVAKSPADRFQSMSEVASAFEAMLAPSLQANSRLSESITASSQSAEPNLHAFLDSVTGRSLLIEPELEPTQTSDVPRSQLSQVDGHAPTVTLFHPQQETDPVSERSIQLARQDRSQTVFKSEPRRQQWSWRIAAIGVLGIVAVLLSFLFRPAPENEPRNRPTNTQDKQQAATTNSNRKEPGLELLPSQSPPISAAALFTSPDFVWSSPENLGPAINTKERESSPVLTADELRLVFSRGGNIWESRRNNIKESFGPPRIVVNANPPGVSLGEGISITLDGLLLTFTSPRKEGVSEDIWVAQRDNLDSMFGAPIRLPDPVNTVGVERNSIFSADGLLILLTNPQGNIALFQRPTRDATFSPVNSLLNDANSTGWDSPMSLSHDGLVLLTTSDNQPRFCVRKNASEPFGPTQILPPPFDQLAVGKLWLSADCQRIYFHSRNVPNGYGELDLWVVHRQPK